MQDFLQLGKQNSAPSPAHATKATVASVTEKQVELRVVLPDRSTVTVTIQEFWRTPEVYQVSWHSSLLAMAWSIELDPPPHKA